MRMKIKLGNICRFQSGGTPSRNNPAYFSGDIPWITTTALDGTMLDGSAAIEWITQEAIAKSAAKIVPKHSIMVGTRVGIGKAAINGVEMSTSQDIISLIDIDDNRWDKRYICDFIQSKNEYLNLQARGATIKGIKIDVLAELQLPDISVAEQHKVSEILNTCRRAIGLRKRQLTKLDELVKSRFVEMFGTYPSNEKGWDTGTIRDLVAEVRYGSSRKAADGDSGQYPYLRMNNITYNGELDLSDTKTIDIPDEELDKCTVRRGDVLFNRTNSKELVGKTCVYNRDEMMVLAGFVIRVRVNERILPEVLSAFLNTDFSKQMLYGMGKAAIGQANINAQELQNIGIYIPPIELQKEYVRFKKQVDKVKLSVQKSLEGLEILKKSLMWQYFG